jgi:autotransporter-associated beta strand protein
MRTIALGSIRSLYAFLAGAFALSIGLPFAAAQTSSGWKGTTNGDFQTSSNWDAGFGPSFNLFFGNSWVTAGGTGATTITNASTYSGFRLTFEANASTPTFTLQGSAITLFNFGTQVPKIENLSSVNQNVNTAITFGTGADHGEINAVNGNLTLGGTITNTATNGIRLYGSGQTVNFNGAVTATGKYIGVSTAGTGNTININNGSTVTASDFSVMNNGILNLNSGGALTASVRLGLDYTGSGNLVTTQGGTFNLAATAGTQTFSSTINSGNGTTNQDTVNAKNTTGTDTLSGHIALDSSLTITEAAGTGTLTINQAKGVDTTTGNDIKGNTETLTAGAGSTINHSGTIYNSTGNGSILMNGAGTLQLSGANTFSGGATLQQGTLVLGVATVSGTTITSSPVGTGTFHIGSGTNSATLEASTASGTARVLNNNISLEGDTTFAPGPSQTTGRITLNTIGTLTTPNTITLTRTNQLTVNPSVTLDLIGAISGPTFGITKLGAGTLNIGSTTSPDAVANTYNGLTTVSAGSVTLNKTANTDALAGNLQIDGTGTVTLGANNENINNGSNLTINTGGTLATNGRTETIGNLTVGGGTASGSGTLIIAGAGNTTVNSGTVSVTNLTTGTAGLTLGSGATVSSATTLNGNVTFNGATTGATFGNSAISLNGNRNFTVATGTSGTDLTVGGAVSNGTGTSGITKLGTGNLLVTGANTFSGGMTLNTGALTLGATSVITSGALVSSSVGLGTFKIGSGTNVTALETNAAVGTIRTVSTNVSLDGDVTFAPGTGQTTGRIALNTTGIAGGNQLTTPNTITLTRTNQLTVNNGFTLDLTGAISGSGFGFTELGSGTLNIGGSVLTPTDNNANTYSGLTTVSGGTLALNKVAGTNAIAGDGNTATNDVTINGGTLRWLASNQVADTVTISISSGTLDFNGKNETFNNLNVSGGTVNYGSGTVAITDPTWSGGTNSVIGNTSFGELTVSNGTNTVSTGGVLTVGGATDATNGGTDLVFTGTNSPNITLNSDNTAAGKLVLAGNVTVDSGLTSGTASITSGLSNTNPGQLDLGGVTRTFTINDGSAAVDMSVSAQIINGGLTKAGAGTLALSGSNTYTSGTNVNNGTLALGASNVLADAGAVNVGGGTFDIGANSDTVGVVTLTSGNINGTTGTLTASSYGVQSGAISAQLGGTGALTKTTAGTVILTGANSYSGGTNVNAGTLALNANNVLPTSGIVSMGGGTLQLNGTQQGTTPTPGAGPMSLASSSIIDLASTDILHFAASGGQTWSGTLSIYNWNGTPTAGGGLEQILFGTDTTSTSLTAAQLAQINFYSDAGSTLLGGGGASFATAGDGEIVPMVSEVPEPSTWVVGALVAASLLVSQRRRFVRRKGAATA